MEKFYKFIGEKEIANQPTRIYQRETWDAEITAAYQKVLDECDNISDAEEIKEAFESYVILTNNQ
tara:strand:+ start:330 stop:524 length:195 start_codon:yes stop_codon:yes gene_type:complete